jgi:hypothetical protein
MITDLCWRDYLVHGYDDNIGLRSTLKWTAVFTVMLAAM